VKSSLFNFAKTNFKVILFQIILVVILFGVGFLENGQSVLADTDVEEGDVTSPSAGNRARLNQQDADAYYQEWLKQEAGTSGQTVDSILKDQKGNCTPKVNADGDIVISCEVTTGTNPKNRKTGPLQDFSSLGVDISDCETGQIKVSGSSFSCVDKTEAETGVTPKQRENLGKSQEAFDKFKEGQSSDPDKTVDEVLRSKKAKCEPQINSSGETIISCTVQTGNREDRRGNLEDWRELGIDVTGCKSGKVKANSDGSYSCLSEAEAKMVDDLDANDAAQTQDFRRQNNNSSGDEEGDGGNFFTKFANEAGKIILLLIFAIVDILLFIFVLIFKVAFLMVGYLGLWLILLNPASPEYLPLLGEVWGLLASLANLMIIGGMIFLGATKIMGIPPWNDKDVGEILLRLIFYGVLLNFSFFIGAALVNIGYGIVFLLILSRGKDPTNFGEAADAILLQYINAISDTDGLNKIGLQSIGTAFSKGLSEAVSESGAIVGMRFIELVVVGVGVWTMVILIKTVIFQKVRTFFSLAISAITVALFFNPIDSFKDQGKKLLNRLLVDAAFAPIAVGIFILVGVFIQKASEIMGANPPRLDESSILQVEAQAQASDNVIDLFMQALADASGKVLVAILAAGAMYQAAKWLENRYEEDIKAAGGAVSGAVSGAWNATRDVSYRVGGVGRGVGRGMTALGDATGVNRFLSNSGVNKWRKKSLAGDNGLAQKYLAGTLGNIGSTVTGLATGKTLLQLEAAGKIAKGIWDGTQKRVESEKADIEAREVLKNSANVRLAAQAWGSVPVAGAVNPFKAASNALDYTDLDPYTKVNDLTEVNIDEEADVAGRIAAGKVYSPQVSSSEKARIARFKSIQKTLAANQNLSTEDEDTLIDYANTALENDDNRFIELLSTDKAIVNKLQEAYKDDKLTQKGAEAVRNKYLQFLRSDVDAVQAVKRRILDRDFNPTDSTFFYNNGTLMDAAVQQLEEAAQNGDQFARSRLADVKTRWNSNIPFKLARIYDQLNRKSDSPTLEFTEGTASYFSSDKNQTDTMKRNGVKGFNTVPIRLVNDPQAGLIEQQMSLQELSNLVANQYESPGLQFSQVFKINNDNNSSTLNSLDIDLEQNLRNPSNPAQALPQNATADLRRQAQQIKMRDIVENVRQNTGNQYPQEMSNTLQDIANKTNNDINAQFQAVQDYMDKTTKIKAVEDKNLLLDLKINALEGYTPGNISQQQKISAGFATNAKLFEVNIINKIKSANQNISDDLAKQLAKKIVLSVGKDIKNNNYSVNLILGPNGRPVNPGTLSKVNDILASASQNGISVNDLNSGVNMLEQQGSQYFTGTNGLAKREVEVAADLQQAQVQRVQNVQQNFKTDSSDIASWA